MIRRWRPRVLFIAACVLGLVSSALFARQGILSTNDGRIMQGDIEEAPDGQSVNITIKGATVTLDRNTVASINYSDNVQVDYRKRLAALDPNDITGRLQLSRMELNAGQYNLAVDAAKDAERLDPHNPDAAILLDTIRSQQNLDSRAPSADTTTQPSPDVALTPTTNPVASNYLTLDDVQAIRRFELDPSDNVRVDFFNNVRQRYLSSSQTDAAGFGSLTPAQQALQIMQSNDSKLIKDVRIANDPRVMAEFHSRVLPRVLVGCLRCHGPSNGTGGFVLFPDSRDPTVWYTDFYILQKAGFKVHSTDIFGSGPVYRHMIDRMRPEDSLLLNFGLPQSVATMPHPKAAGFEPMFHGLGDENYLDLGKWIASLKAIAPDYGIKYNIPTGVGPTGAAPTGVAPTTQGQ